MTDLDPNSDTKLDFESGSEHADNFGSGWIRIHSPMSLACHGTVGTEPGLGLFCIQFVRRNVVRSVL